MPTRGNGTLATGGGIVFNTFRGGWLSAYNDETLETVTTLSVYDPATDQWTDRAALPYAVSHIGSGAFVLNGRIIIAGGETAHTVATNRVTIYDPATDKWTSLTNLPAARFSGVGAVIGGHIIFTGGSSQTTTWHGVPS